MTEPLDLLRLAALAGAAAGLGALIGLERQWRVRSAGMRTNALVALGAALFVILGAEAIPGEGADPTRVAAQVASGIGFLGAGVILREGLNIRGLTTAATLWCAAAMGCLAGAGMVDLAAVATALVVAVNVILRPVSSAVTRRRIGRGERASEPEPRAFVLEVVTTLKAEHHVRSLLLQATTHPDVTLRGINVREAKQERVRVRAEVNVEGSSDDVLVQTASRLGGDPKVTSARWWVVEEADD